MAEDFEQKVKVVSKKNTDNFLEECRLQLAQIMPKCHDEFMQAWHSLDNRGKVDTYLNLARIVLPTVKAINMDMTAQLTDSVESRLGRLTAGDTKIAKLPWEGAASEVLEENAELIDSKENEEDNDHPDAE